MKLTNNIEKETNFNSKLWSKLYDMSKTELRELLAKHNIIRTKSLTKYQLIVKAYELTK